MSISSSDLEIDLGDEHRLKYQCQCSPELIIILLPHKHRTCIVLCTLVDYEANTNVFKHNFCAFEITPT